MAYSVLEKDAFLDALGPDIPNPIETDSLVAIFRKANLDDQMHIPIVVCPGVSVVPRSVAGDNFGPLLRVIGEWTTELVVLALRREPTNEETQLLVSACATALRMTRGE